MSIEAPKVVEILNTSRAKTTDISGAGATVIVTMGY